ncbi:protocatechuate 3,4-dioxygenase subunit alpha [Georgenia sp. SYP-B2076]|uniref:protocatechuate 3,4-dioxygenase subunit alpha n=1 Tax=Georgenia sp. SYP-B2076 TaxID=2495881 RepID=UPI000F8CBE9A|nr:protocatechuate 3,4-dioxygenase subunit alpha [Georgenia sp. SYP-B2076]
MSERLGLTPSQTVGPYLAIGLDWGAEGRMVVPEGTPGAFWITGLVLDGDGEPMRDALVETWQADPEGRFDTPEDPRGARPSTVEGFTGLGRSATWEDDLSWRVHTVRPGALPAADVDGADGPVEAPHIDVNVLARGMLDRCVTRIYFPGEPLNDTDPVLQSVPADRRGTLIARRDGDGYRFDIRVQGPGETVFFAV